MDVVTIFTSVISSVAVTAAGAWWLGKKWIEYKLSHELENRKGEIRKEIENELGESAAQREYEYSARRRLYTAVGPLRFKLLLASRDLALHVQDYGLGGVNYSLKPDNYYGKSTLYRLMLPLVIAELIERQVAIADFSVDSEAIKLLQFKKAGYRAYKSDKLILNHPNADWPNQREHLFHHTVSTIIDSLIIKGERSEPRPMYFREFEESLPNNHVIGPLVQIVSDFSISSKPIFWIRMVFLAYICSQLVNSLGIKIGFKKFDCNLQELLKVSEDKFTLINISKLEKQFEIIANEGL